ncbi:hypothetical protein B0H11DRAFT_880855 [Mycena galericulata]|nr:hypothetical protein B0H11DRAFT_880855 [Mycena galericulata]
MAGRLANPCAPSSPPSRPSRHQPRRARRQDTHLRPSLGRAPRPHPRLCRRRACQICVDGYDPVHRGLPKALEMDPALSDLFAAEGGRGLRVADCALITLEDKAFAIKPNDAAPEDRWDQRHLGVAFKFDTSGVGDGWHCVWAILQDHDAATGECVFRTYDDVYLEHLGQRSPRKARRRKGSGPASAVPRPALLCSVAALFHLYLLCSLCSPRCLNAIHVSIYPDRLHLILVLILQSSSPPMDHTPIHPSNHACASHPISTPVLVLVPTPDSVDTLHPI